MSKKIAHFFLSIGLLLLICHSGYSATETLKPIANASLDKDQRSSVKKNETSNVENSKQSIEKSPVVGQNEIQVKDRLQNNESVSDLRIYDKGFDWLDAKNFEPVNKLTSNANAYTTIGSEFSDNPSNQALGEIAGQLQEELIFEFGDEMYAKVASTYKKLKNVDTFIQSSLSEVLVNNSLISRQKQYLLNLDQQIISINISSSQNSGADMAPTLLPQRENSKIGNVDGSFEKLSAADHDLLTEKQEMKFFFILKYFSLMNFIYVLVVILVVTAIARSLQSTLRKK